MTDFEKLVPELDLCKRIPEGAFAESLLVWTSSCDKRKTEPFVEERDCIDFCRRDMVNAPPVYPAPTLQEIMDELVLSSNDPDCFWTGGWYVKGGLIAGEFEEYDMTSPVTAALKLWLKINNQKWKG